MAVIISDQDGLSRASLSLSLSLLLTLVYQFWFRGNSIIGPGCSGVFVLCWVATKCP